MKKQRPHQKKRATAIRRKARRALVAQRVTQNSRPRASVDGRHPTVALTGAFENTQPSWYVQTLRRGRPRLNLPRRPEHLDARAALLLLLPALLTASVFVPTQRAKAPMPRTIEAVAPRGLAAGSDEWWRYQSSFKQSHAGGTSTALQTPVPARPRLALSLPSAPGRQTASDTTSAAMADLPLQTAVEAHISASPYVRPPEAHAATIPVAVHDLARAAAALAGDIDATRAAFTRPAEALIAALSGTGDLLQKKERSSQVPFSRTPEALIAGLRPLPVDNPDPAKLEVVATAPVASPSCPAPAGLLAVKSAPPRAPVDPAIADDPLKFGRALAAAAQAQTRDLVVYNAAYMTIAYPGGDVPLQFGVCTDVVIRAYRALDIDLQELVHLSRPGRSDTNIDHRRTELLRGFFATYGEHLAVTPFIEDYLPGDIVTYYRPQNKSSTAHIALVSNVTAPSGRPMIVHNRGWGVQLEDALFVDQITGHYRFRGIKPAQNIAVADSKAKERVSLTSDAGASAGDVKPSSPLPVRQRLTATALRLAALKPAFAGGTRMGLGGGNNGPASRCDANAKACATGAR